MSFLHDNALIGASGAGGAAAGFQIDRSLRFNNDDQAYLSRTPSSATNRKTWTWSGWVKKSSINLTQNLFSASGGGSRFSGIRFASNDQLAIFDYNGSSFVYNLTTTHVFRDVSSWYHVFVAFDSTQATSSDRLKLYINGGLISDYSNEAYPSLNLDSYVNNTYGHTLACSNSSGYTEGFDGYLAEVYFLDGQALAATDFGEYDDNNVWQPKEFGGTYISGGISAANGALPIYNTTDDLGKVKGTGLRTDANSSNLVLAVAMDGSNGGTTFTDESSSSHSITLLNTPETSTVDSRYYGSSGKFDNGDGLSFGTSNDFAFGTGDFTIEAWLKLGTDDQYTLWDSGTVNANGHCTIFGTGSSMIARLKPGTDLSVTDATSGIATGQWFHLAITRESGTLKMWVNGVLKGSQANSSDVTATGGRTGTMNGYPSNYLLDGYMQDLRVYKGVAKYTANFTPPAEDSNSFFLNFSDNTSTTTIGEDSSGIDSDWTANNISVTAGADNDSLIDTPTNYTASSGNNGGNYATWNSLTGNTTLSNGNLDSTGKSGYNQCLSTIGMSSGKYYCEITIVNNNGYAGVGIATRPVNGTFLGNTTSGYLYYSADGKKRTSGTNLNYGDSYTTGDTIGIAFDADGGNLYFYKNGTIQNSGTAAFTGLTSGPYFFVVDQYNNSNDIVGNFGQRPFSISSVPTGYKSLCTTNFADPAVADGSTAMDATLYTGNGSTQTITGLNFASAPDLVWIKNRTDANRNVLTDAVRGVTKEISSDQTTAETTRTNGLTAFNSDGFTLGSYSFYNRVAKNYVAWSWDGGSNSSKTYTVKVVSDSGNKYRFDDFGTSAVTLDLEEGSTYVFDQSDSSNSGHPLRFSTTSDGTHNSGTEYTTGVTTTGTPGSAGAKTTIVVAASAPTLYYYCSAHSGMGGQANTNSTAGASNFDGTHQATVRANSSTGFSISIHSRTTAASISTWGHGLGAAPEFAILMPYNGSYNRIVWHKSMGYRKRIYFNGTGGSNSYSFDVWSSDSTTLGVYGTIITGGGTALDCATFAWAPIEGYSAFGSYEGTGSGNGPFVFTGFRPKLIMTKDIDSSSNWNVYDTSRDPDNVAGRKLSWNLANAESTLTAMDILSSGFKIRTSNADMNENTRTFIWAAWAEHPFKTARAR